MSDTSDSSQTTHILIGTAGHIDHGKTRLVGRLTNVNTDRLPEEKTRGISIDLGFAHWDAGPFRFGVVDVPGHERFVKNMVAGATGINLALLVIAADDCVMPQTREHLEIMDLLGVRHGLIAVTKMDLVEPDFLELIQAEIEELVEGTFLENCPLMPVSSETGNGIEELKQAITQTAQQVQSNRFNGFFRMPIDRAFSIDGHGTIVTGSVLSGNLQAGEKLELLPDKRELRVRSVQTHKSQAEQGGARQRTAINLANIKPAEVPRGCELATPGCLQPTTRLLVELRTLPSSPIVLKDRSELGLHLGTREELARLVLKGKQLKPGEAAYAELRLRKPIVAMHDQKFILRRVSPARTVAGGRVLDASLPPAIRIRNIDSYGSQIADPDPRARLSFVLSQMDTVPEARGELVARVNIEVAELDQLVEDLLQDGVLRRIAGRDRNLVMHADRLAQVCRSVLRTIRQEIERHQPRRSLPRERLLSACSEIARPEILDLVFERLRKDKTLVRVGDNLGPADAQVQLSRNQRNILSQILEQVTQSGITPPTAKELAAAHGQSLAQIEDLLTVAAEDGLLIKVSADMHFAPESLEAARQSLASYLDEHQQATLSALREAWGISRKFAVPLCEYFDNLQLTIRDADQRRAGPQLSEPLRF